MCWSFHHSPLSISLHHPCGSSVHGYPSADLEQHKMVNWMQFSTSGFSMEIWCHHKQLALITTCWSPDHTQGPRTYNQSSNCRSFCSSYGDLYEEQNDLQLIVLVPCVWSADQQVVITDIHVTTHISLQLLIQPWICALDTHYSWVDQVSVEIEVCPTLLHMASTGNRTPDLLILSPMPYPLGHMLKSEEHV